MHSTYMKFVCGFLPMFEVCILGSSRIEFLICAKKKKDNVPSCKVLTTSLPNVCVCACVCT